MAVHIQTAHHCWNAKLITAEEGCPRDPAMRKSTRTPGKTPMGPLNGLRSPKDSDHTLRPLKHEGSWVEESWWIVGYIRHLPQKLIWMQYTMRGKVQETFPIQKSSWDFWPVVTNRSEKKKLELYRLRLSRFKSSFPSWSILKARSHMSSRSGPDSGAMKTRRSWCILS